MKAINALVTAVGGTIGQSICKALRQSSMKIRITGLDMDRLASGFFLCDSKYLVPSVDDPKCYGAIAKIIERGKIDAVFVSSDKELKFFSRNRGRFEESTGVKILVSDPRVIGIGNDKWKTFLFFRENYVVCPETALADDRLSVNKLVRKIGFPLIVKPRFSSGSRDVYKADNMAELKVFIKRVPEAVVQEYIPIGDGEFTGASFCGVDGRILGTIVMRRELNHGTTFRSELVRGKKYYRFVEKVVSLLRPYGSCNVQFRSSGGRISPIEINTRFSSTTCIRSRMGFNDAEMALKVFVLGENVKRVRLERLIALRYWEEIFISGRALKYFRPNNNSQSKGGLL